MTTSADDLLQCAIERFWDAIPPVWGRVRGNARANAVRDYNITLIQFHILRHIRRGAHSVSELAELLQISRPAISQAVDLLVDKDLVTRRQDTKDRRYVQLELTVMGDSLISSIFSKNRLWMAEKMKVLKPDELEILIRGMDILKTTFDSSDA